MTREELLKKEYEDKLSTLRKEQDNCAHKWNEPVYDPEIKYEPSDFELEFQGSDCWHRSTGFHNVEYPRWSRTCKKCGKVEYTKEQEIIATRPKFY